MYQAEMRAWEAAQQRWQERNPDLKAAEYPAALAAAEEAAAAATGQRETLEYSTAGEAVAAAESASVFRRAAAQKDTESARRNFQRRHKAVAAEIPSKDQRAAWARAAVALGANTSLDAASKAEKAAIAKRTQLQVNPAPSSEKPTAPRPGTAQQEASKDTAYQARRASWDRQQDASKDQAAQAATAQHRQIAGSGTLERRVVPVQGIRQEKNHHTHLVMSTQSGLGVTAISGRTWRLAGAANTSFRERVSAPTGAAGFLG